jgi:nicotinamide mononucleotide transporter
MMESIVQGLGPLLAPAFSLWDSPVTWAEIVAFVLSIWMVACNMRVHPLGWPLAIVSSLLYALLFASYRLYGEASLQLFFVLISAWGWRQWLLGTDDGTALRVHSLSAHQRLIAVALTAAAWPVLGYGLHRWTNSDVPYLDALPTVASVAGQILLGRKLIENWPVWVMVNVVSVALFAAKALWLTVILYALFALLAMLGWRAWQGLRGQVRAASA